MSGGGEAVDLGLHPNMRRSFELKIPPPFVLIEMTFERANGCRSDASHAL